MKNLLCVLFLVLTLFSCTTNPSQKLQDKSHANDPFKSTMVSSQYFDVDAKTGGTLASKSGIVMAIPEEAFVDEDGKVVSGMVKVELAEALELQDMLLSGLETLTDKNEILQSGGMFYFNATANGKQVFINPDKPIYMEIPASGPTDGFMLYTGQRDEEGKIKWKDPKPLENWLVSIDLDLLDFYPNNFETAVEEEMPFRKYQTATKALKDSLFYSLSPNDKRNIYYSDTDEKKACSNCGISPAKIKVLKTERFNNTIISTREFSERLKEIYKTCDDKVLEVYINNIDKNLWECDSMAAELLNGKSDLQNKFKSYASLKQTKVKTDRNLSALAAYYKKQLKNTEEELNKARTNYEKYLKKKDEEARKAREEYSKLLTKRLHYRMNKFGFVLTENGWKNIDKHLGEPVYIKPMEIEVYVKEGNTFDRVHVYVVNKQIKSIFSLLSSDKVKYDSCHREDNILLMWDNQPAMVSIIAYKGDTPYYTIVDFTVVDKVVLQAELAATTEVELRKQLSTLNRFYNRENKIVVDLEFQEKFYKEKLRQEQLFREHLMMGKLASLTFPCACDDDKFAEGRQLFVNNCSSCHDLFNEGVGPALKGISYRQGIEWNFSFIRNSSKRIAKGDIYAVQLFEKYNRVEMPSFPEMSDEQIWEILKYIDCIEEREEKAF